MKRENYKNFILKTLWGNDGTMERNAVYRKFEEKFLQGDGKRYLHPEELVGEEYEDYWYNALSWAKSELRVDGLLQKGNPMGLWRLTAEGEKATKQLWPAEDALYLENMPQQIREALAKIIDREAKKQFVQALLHAD